MDDFKNVFPDDKTSQDTGPNGFDMGDAMPLEPYEGRTALVDADMLVYAVCFTCEGKPFSECVTVFNQKFTDIKINAQAVDAVLYLTSDDRSNYRFDVAKTLPYKGNRDDKEKPEHYEEFRNWLVKHRGAIMVYGEEADDMMSKEPYENLRENYAAYCDEAPMQYRDFQCFIAHFEECPEEYAHTIICTDDKDLNIVPGFHYRLRTREVYWCSHLGHVEMKGNNKLWGSGFKFFCAQLLMGDKTDNIPGIAVGADPNLLNTVKAEYGIRKGRGFGDKGAYQAVVDARSVEEAIYTVFDMYRKCHTNPFERLTEVGQLLWMRSFPGEMWQLRPTWKRYLWEKLKEEWANHAA